jgi:hypothetical protein
MDNEHRKEVAKEIRGRADIRVHMVNLYLGVTRGSGVNYADNSSGSSFTGKSKKSRYHHPCSRYNSNEGCNNGSCKFQPVCSVRGCRGDHLKYRNAKQPSGEDREDFRTGVSKS